MAGQQPEPGVDVIERRLDQAEAVDGGPSDGEEVGVVGLVAGIGRRGGTDLEASGWTTRASRPAATAARLIGVW